MEEGVIMCCDKKEMHCEHPEKLKGKKPGECTPKQVKECHGEARPHPCKGEKGKDK
jgi:hypothetical protein